MPSLWSPTQLREIEQLYPTPEVAVILTEVRRLHTIVMRAEDVIREWGRTRKRGGQSTEDLRAGLTSLKESMQTPCTPLQQ